MFFFFFLVHADGILLEDRVSSTVSGLCVYAWRDFLHFSTLLLFEITGQTPSWKTFITEDGKMCI